MKTTKHLDQLDFYRGVAIALVFICHVVAYCSPWGRFEWTGGGYWRDLGEARNWLDLALFPFSLSWAGVPLFFVISGFCIHLSHARGTDGWNTFFWRRLWRIYPPYVFAVALVCAIAFLSRHGDLHAFEERFTLPDIPAHLALVHNFSSQWYMSVSGSFWSIAVEVQLYLLYPLLVALVRKFSWGKALAFVAAIEIGLRLAAGINEGVLFRPSSILLTFCPFYFWFSWSLGAYLAHRYLAGEPLVPARWISGALLALFFAVALFQPLAAMGFLLFALFSYTLLCRAIFRPGEISTRGWLPRHMTSVGVCSYSFYLLHMPIIGWWYNLLVRLGIWPHLDAVLQCVVFVPLWFVAFGVSRLSYRFIERPSVALGKAIWSGAYFWRPPEPRLAGDPIP